MQSPTKSRNPDRFIYPLIIWLAVFIPGHLGGFLVEQIFIALTVMTSIYVVVFPVADANPFNISRFGTLLFFLLLQFLYVLSFFLYEVKSLGGATGVRDLFEMVRYFVCFFIFTLVVHAHPRCSSRMAKKLIIATLAFSLFIAALYVVQIPFITGLFEDVIYEATKDDLSQISTGGRVRFAAPFPNPNYLAYFLCLALGLVLFLYAGVFRFSVVIITLLILFLTGSRTGWAVAALLLCLYLTFNAQRLFSGGGEFGSVLLMAALVSFGYVLSTSEVLPVLKRVSEVIGAVQTGDVSAVASFAHRMQHNSFIWETVQESLFWGVGPSKYSLTTVIDNQYLMWLARQGLVGTAVMIFGVFFCFYKMMRVAPSRAHKYCIVSFFTVIFLFGLTGAFLNNFRLFLLTLFFGACILDSCMKVAPLSPNKEVYS